MTDDLPIIFQEGKFMRPIHRSFITGTMQKLTPRFCRLALTGIFFPGVIVLSWFACRSYPLYSEDNIFSQATGSVPYYSQTEASGTQSAADAPRAITGPASRITQNSTTLHGVVNAHGLSTTVWFQYRIVNGPSKITAATQTVIGTDDTGITISIIELFPGSTYYYRLVAKNDAGTSYGREMSFTTLDIDSSIAMETTQPVGGIVINEGASSTNSLTVAATLSATDNTGITGYYLSASSLPPSQHSAGWISVPATTDYRDKVPFVVDNGNGATTVFVWYKDASGNISDAASDAIVVDTTPPIIMIQDPTSDQIYATTSETISIGGDASDDLNEITSIVWTNNRETYNTDRNTLNWIIPHVLLAKGDNVITVKAADRVGNTGIAKITITYTTGDNAPLATTGLAASITTDLATLGGTVHAMGLPTTAWFQYGTSSRQYSSMSPIQDVEELELDTPVGNRLSGLQAGTTYYYRLVAQNSAGSASGGEMTFTTLPLKGRIYGKVVRFQKGDPIESVKVRLKGTKARKKVFQVVFSDTHGLFTIDNLDADTYGITATKTDFTAATQIVELKEGEEKKIEISLQSREKDKEEPKDTKIEQPKANETPQNVK